MSHKAEHDLSHRQEREKKHDEQASSTPGGGLASLHPAWYVIVGVVLIGTAVFVWTFLLPVA